MATNDLDEHIIASLKQQGAKINVWGVGTQLVTAYDQPAWAASTNSRPSGSRAATWKYKMKLSEQAIKVSTPGILQVRRFRGADGYQGDAIFDEIQGAARCDGGPCTIVDPKDPTRHKTMPAGAPFDDLLQPVMRQGRIVAVAPSIHQVRDTARQQLAGFHASIKRFVNPHEYPVGLEQGLHELKTRLILDARATKA